LNNIIVTVVANDLDEIANPRFQDNANELGIHPLWGIVIIDSFAILDSLSHH